jgi:hypothetical protein
MQICIFFNKFGINGAIGFIAIRVKTHEHIDLLATKYMGYNITKPVYSAIFIHNVSNIKPFGEDHMPEFELNIIPNPATGSVCRTSELSFKRIIEPTEEIVYTQSTQKAINVSFLAAGVLFSATRIRKYILQFKFIKQ